MQLGVLINYYSFGGAPSGLGPLLAEIARTADDAGFTMIGAVDHVWQHPIMGGAELEELEGYTTLGFLAAHTRRAKLITLVTCPPYRQPGLLAKIVTTLDVLSGGRAWLGIGAGDYVEEARGLGLPFPPVKQRFEMLEETIQICLRMWSGARGDEGAFRGTYYQLERLLNSPQSLSRPHPPILIGGNGEQKTLRLVARYADACNLSPSPELPRKLEVLRQHCAAEGRDYDAIEKTCMFGFDIGENGSQIGELIGRLRWLSSMGIQTVIGAIPQRDPVATLDAIGREVLPAVAEL
jgi:F420-dependent oxidoreductase-like protein